MYISICLRVCRTRNEVIFNDDFVIGSLLLNDRALVDLWLEHDVLLVDQLRLKRLLIFTFTVSVFWLDSSVINDDFFIDGLLLLKWLLLILQ